MAQAFFFLPPPPQLNMYVAIFPLQAYCQGFWMVTCKEKKNWNRERTVLQNCSMQLPKAPTMLKWTGILYRKILKRSWLLNILRKKQCSHKCFSLNQIHCQLNCRVKMSAGKLGACQRKRKNFHVKWKSTLGNGIPRNRKCPSMAQHPVHCFPLISLYIHQVLFAVCVQYNPIYPDQQEVKHEQVPLWLRWLRTKDKLYANGARKLGISQPMPFLKFESFAQGNLWPLQGETVPRGALTLESGTVMCRGHDPLFSGQLALLSLPIYHQCATHVPLILNFWKFLHF